jgi:hypothetical protein
MDRAAAAKEAHAQRLMVDPAILAVGVGVSEKNPSQAVVNIYVQTGRSHGSIPAELDGVRTQIIRTDLIRRMVGMKRRQLPATPARPRSNKSKLLRGLGNFPAL